MPVPAVAAAAPHASACTRLGPYRVRLASVSVGRTAAQGSGARHLHKVHAAASASGARAAASSSPLGAGPLGDPHRVLGIEPGSDQATIKKAFRRLCLRYHPDVSHAEGAQERFQAVQIAYDTLMERLHAAENAASETGLGSWPRRRRPAPDEPAAAPAAAAPEVPQPPTPEQQQERWKQQLGGLGKRAAAQRERRASEMKYRAAMREHAVRGSFSGVASTDAGRERLRDQLSDLYYAAAAATGGALETHTVDKPEAHLLSANASGLSARAAQAADDASEAPPPPPPPLSASEKEVMQQLLRLARVAQTWRTAQGSFAANSEPSEESLTPGE